MQTGWSVGIRSSRLFVGFGLEKQSLSPPMPALPHRECQWNDIMASLGGGEEKAGGEKQAGSLLVTPELMEREWPDTTGIPPQHI